MATLVLMPTGGGKSLLQILALARQRAATSPWWKSPLIALMHDQVGALHEAGGSRLLNSTPERRRSQRGGKAPAGYGRHHAAVCRARAGDHARFLAQLDSLHERGQLSLFAIDEQALREPVGHDFRPEYRALTLLHERYPACRAWRSPPRPMPSPRRHCGAVAARSRAPVRQQL